MKAKHALIHDTFTLERRYPSARAKIAGEHEALPLTTVKNSVPRNHSNKRLEKICREIYLSLILQKPGTGDSLDRHGDDVCRRCTTDGANPRRHGARRGR